MRSPPKDDDSTPASSATANGHRRVLADWESWSSNDTTSLPKTNGSVPAGSRSHAPIDSSGQYQSDSSNDDDDKKLAPVATESSGVEVDLAKALSRDTIPVTVRRSSIPITLEKTERKGRYLLTADDPEIREILRRGLERQEHSSSSKEKRSSLRELVFTRRFTTFDRQNPSTSDSPFYGFFTLFWLAMALLLVRVAVHNWRFYGSVLGNNELLRMMFGREVIALGLTDGVMCVTTSFGLGLQLLVLRGYLDWNKSGWIIQNSWQTFYLGAIIGWTFYREWPWTHTIFITLHALVFVMKQHSYAFYNGYLSQLYKRKQSLERRLAQLNNMSPLASPLLTSTVSSTGSYFSGGTADARHRRTSSSGRKGNNLATESSEVASVAAAISSGQPLDSDQMQAFSNIISSEIALIDEELRGKCTITDNHYPKNLTLFNWAEWTCLPTLVYELEYPRQERIDWWYVLEKAGAVFGVLAIMQVISQAYIYPPVKEAVRMKTEGMSLEQRWTELPFLVLDMLFPLLLEQLLTWYLIWECVLNVLAELTCFADRGFYGEWWNSVSWDQYARDWNRPVHNFLLRHVYHSSISAFQLSKMSAMFVTFFLSALVHELLMFMLFKKVRGYLFTMQLMQVPLAGLSRTKLLKDRKLLGNVIFWAGLFIGPSFLTSLYIVV